MTKYNKWLAVALFVSWTLNVALIVALYLNARHPVTSTVGLLDHPLPDPFEMPVTAGMVDESVRMQMQKMRDFRRKLMMDFADCMADDRLDTGRINALADSLHAINGRINKIQLTALMQMHSQLPPSARHEVVLRMMQRMRSRGMMHSPGRMWMMDE